MYSPADLASTPHTSRTLFTSPEKAYSPVPLHMSLSPAESAQRESADTPTRSLLPSPTAQLPTSFARTLDFSDLTFNSTDKENEQPEPLVFHAGEEKTFSKWDSPIAPSKRPLSEAKIPHAKRSLDYAQKTREIARALLPTSKKTESPVLKRATSLVPSPISHEKQARSCMAQHTPSSPLPTSPTRNHSHRAALSTTPPPSGQASRRAPSIAKHAYKFSTISKHNWACVLPKAVAPGTNPQDNIDPHTKQQKLYWTFNEKEYWVRPFARGQFHQVFTFVEGNIIALQVRTLSDVAADEKQPYALDQNHSSLSKWKTISLNTRDIVLRILQLNDAGAEKYEREKLREITADNALDKHCLDLNIPLVKKITSPVPGGHVLPFECVTPPGAKSDVLGWELCKRVETGVFIKTVCQGLREFPQVNLDESLDFLCIPNPPKGGIHHLFQWLLEQWKENVTHMFATRQVGDSATKRKHLPLGEPRLGDFRPDNIGYDSELEAFVCIDLKIDVDAEADFCLREGLTAFLGAEAPSNLLRQLVVEELLAHVLSFNPDPDFIHEFQKRVY